MSEGPKGGFAKLVPELHVNDLQASLSFWRDACGFSIAYQRDEERFVFLELDGAQIMLCQRHGRYETGSMKAPLGQGAMFQVYVESLDRILAGLKAIEWPLYEGLKEKWYRVGDSENGVRQFLVQDPDGYLVLFGQNIGTRP